jgi:hypothetical protein
MADWRQQWRSAGRESISRSHSPPLCDCQRAARLLINISKGQPSASALIERIQLVSPLFPMLAVDSG